MDRIKGYLSRNAKMNKGNEMPGLLKSRKKLSLVSSGRALLSLVSAEFGREERRER
jgi:hypothetical protein